jgi:hypothetical protein
MPRRCERALRCFIAFSALALPAFAHAVSDCSDCSIGVYDDVQLTRTTGTMGAFQVKSVYLGMHLPPGISAQTLRFDAIYPAGFTLLDVSSYIADANYVPQGTGVKVDWPHCVSGTRALFRIRVFSFGAVRDAVLQLRNAEIGSCANPLGERWRVFSGCYVLNPSGRPAGCAVAVEPATWSATKALFK